MLNEDDTPAPSSLYGTKRTSLAMKRKNPSDPSISILAKAAEIRLQNQKDEIELSREKWEDEKRMRGLQYDLEVRKFEEDQRVNDRRLEMEERRLQNEYELEKYRIEQDIKCKIELAKL